MSKTCSEDEQIVWCLHSRLNDYPREASTSFRVPGHYDKSTLSVTSSLYRSALGSSTSPSKVADNCRLIVIDARAKMAAQGNMLKGGGYENTERYDYVALKFMDIGNIHGIPS